MAQLLWLNVHKDVLKFNARQSADHRKVCDVLAREIDAGLPGAENRIWHAHPVWFLDGNPIAGYSRQKPGIRLMFWSGADFGEPGLAVVGGKFKDASVFYNEVSEIRKADLRRWLAKARKIQWDYKNLVRRKGRLEKLKPAAKTAPRARAGKSGFQSALKLAARFPGVEPGTSYGTPAIKVKGRLMARLRPEAEGWLALRCDFLTREMLLQAAPHVFHLTEHYRDYPMILVDLAQVEKGSLAALVEQAWRMTATKTLIREYDSDR